MLFGKKKNPFLFELDGFMVMLWFVFSCCFVTKLTFSLVSKQGEDLRRDHISRSSSEGWEISFSVLVIGYITFFCDQMGAGGLWL